MVSDDRYDEARRHFDELESEDRMRFLLEASVSTLAQGIEEAGRVLSKGLEDVLNRSRQSRSSGSSGQPGPAEPETAQRQAPRGENGSSAS